MTTFHIRRMTLIWQSDNSDPVDRLLLAVLRRAFSDAAYAAAQRDDAMDFIIEQDLVDAYEYWIEQRRKHIPTKRKRKIIN